MAPGAAVLSAALRDAAARGDAAHVARLLTNSNCHVNALDENGYSALQRAAADGHVDVVRVLMQYKSDVNGQDNVHGNTPLHEASWKGYSRCVALLASHKADLHLKNYGGFAPLHLACQNGHNQTCREILLAGCDPDLQNNYGDTSLHTSARYGHAGVTRILISAECKVSIQNKNGDTALHIAAAMARRKLTRILLEAGCDKSLRNKQNETARDIANRKQLAEILDILNMPAFKPKKESKKREKSKEKKEKDVTDSTEAKNAKKAKSREVAAASPAKSKERKKGKNVHFEPAHKWSPYGCHYYPDPKSFPKPKLDSLPTEPLKKGEQYYLDLAGNIRIGPVGVGYTCYCAPFFRHIEDKLDRDKQELKMHIDRAHDRIDKKVNDLEMKTQGQLSELTRCVAAERVLCKERHLHLEQWLSRGMILRQSERVKRLDFSPKGSVDIPPLKRTRSLEALDSSKSWNKVNQIIHNFNQKVDEYETGASRKSSRSTEVLDDDGKRQTFRNRAKDVSLSIEVLDKISAGRSSTDNVDSGRSSSQNVTAEIHIKPNNSQRPPTRNGDIDYDIRNQRSVILNGTSSHDAPVWKSEVLQRTARKNAIPENDSARLDNILHDGYVKLPKQTDDTGKRKSVQELAAKIESDVSRFSIPTPTHSRSRSLSPISAKSESFQVPKPPILKSPKKAKFSLQNLIPFPTRKAFHVPEAKTNGNDSESSDDEDAPIRTSLEPGLMRNSNVTDSLPLPMANLNQQVAQPQANRGGLPPNFTIPKDAYFHDIPHRPNFAYPQNPNYFPNVPQANHGRNRNPLYGSTGLFDAMMQDHMSREIERMPHLYGYQENGIPPPESNNLHDRMQNLAINTQLTELQSQMDRDSHNDSGYSTKVYSSQGPSPSLSGNVESVDLNVNHKLPPLPPNKHNIKHHNVIHQAPQYGASSLV